MSIEKDRHHIWFEKKAYRGKVRREFRNFPGFVLPVSTSVHGDLHHEVDEPPRPTRREMEECIAFLCSIDPKMRQGDFWAIENAIRFFMIKDLEEDDSGSHKNHDRYVATRDNLASQMGVLSVVRAEVVEFPHEEVGLHGIVPRTA